MTAELAGSDPVRLAVAQVEALAADLAAARLADDGSWWLSWSWGDRIARLTEVESAAFKIAYVLTPQAGR